MTLIVGLRCADGVILAADSASGDSHAPIRNTTSDKLWQVSDQPIVFGASGSLGVIQDVKAATSKFKPKASRDAMRRNLVGLIRPALTSAMKGHVSIGNRLCPHAGFLIGGLAGEDLFLLEVTRQAETTWFDDQEGNFYAIGSGAILAHALFRRFWRTAPYDKAQGQLLVYRVVRDAIDLAAQGLGAPVHVVVLNSDGRMRRLSEVDIERLEIGCDLWREMEQDTLGELAGSEMLDARIGVEPLDAVELPKVEDAWQ